MKSNIETINSVQRKLQVEVSSDKVNTEFDKAFKKIQRRAHIKGFRPGKAPMTMIKKLYESNVKAEVGEQLIRQYLNEALSQHDVKPVGWPAVEVKEAPSMDAGFAFHAVVDIMPEIPLQDYKSIAVKCEDYQVSDARVEKELQFMRRRQSKTMDVPESTAAAEGHMVKISHHAKDEAGHDIPALHVHGLTVVMGQGELIGDLEQGIIGMKAGDKKRIDVNVPNDYSEADFAGKKLAFDVTLEKIQELIQPEVNDEFARDLQAESLDDLRIKIKENLQGVATRMKRQRQEGLVLDAILEKNNFEVPPTLVDQVIDSMIKEMRWHNEAEMNAALRNQGLRERNKDEARRRAQNTLLLWKIAEAEKVQVTDEDITAEIAKMIPDAEKNADLIAKYKKAYEKNLRENLLVQKTMDSLIAGSKFEFFSVDL